MQRVSYPYPLEWCEGAIVVQIHRVLAGQHLYVEPSLEFTSYIYPPLYYYVSALPALVFGTGHFAPRLVSLLSILGCFVLLGRWVRDETDDPIAGLAAVGLLSATYQLTGYWFELARVDAFFLLLVFSSHMTARTTKTTGARGAARRVDRCRSPNKAARHPIGGAGAALGQHALAASGADCGVRLWNHRRAQRAGPEYQLARLVFLLRAGFALAPPS